jgi:hypothetical protein
MAVGLFQLTLWAPWSRLCKRSGSVALCGEGAVPGSIQSGVALRFPPHSKPIPAHPEGSPYLPDPLFVPTS